MRKRRGSRPLRGVLLLTALAALLASGLAAAAWRGPGGGPEGGGAGAEGSREAGASGKVVEYQGKRYRRSSHIKAILCIGVDRSGEMTEKTTPGFGGQADGIFLIAQDTARNRIKILMIPRDTMTEITMTDLSGNVLGKDVHHLTMAYAFGDGRETSCRYTAEAVSGLLGGLSMDGYMAADMDSIALLNDSLGGVRVTIETGDLEKLDPELKKGSTVTLEGEQAELFVRYRDTDADHSALYRMDRSQQFILGFLEALQRRSGEEEGIMEELFLQAGPYMVTDLSEDQYMKLGLDALNSRGMEDKMFHTVPGEGVTTQRYDEFYPDQKQLAPLVLELFYREIP